MLGYPSCTRSGDELYDFDAEPEMVRNLTAARGRVVGRLRARGVTLLQEEEARGTLRPDERIANRPLDTELLRSLGYIP